MGDRVTTRRGDDSRLPHAATQHLAPAARRLDEIAAAAEDGADRRAESFRQADGNRVEVLRDRARLDTLLHRGVPQARAVEVHGETVAVGDLFHRGGVARRQHAPADRVLERDEARPGEMRVVGLDRGFDVRQRQRAVARRCRAAAAGRCPAPPRRPPRSGTCALPARRCTRRRARNASSRRRGSTASPTARTAPPRNPAAPATSASSALTLGSSPNTSSPTGAAAIAARIAAVGRVMVSLRKSVAIELPSSSSWAGFSRPRAPGHQSRSAGRTAHPSRFNCGNRMTSRIDGASVSSMTSRSMPIPSPAVGGSPYSMARR